jgi:Acyl-CoA carboxylase epsilon subunit
MTDSEARPELAIVAGRPTAQETAAVVVVLGALLGPGQAGPPQAGTGTGAGSSQWSARSRMLRAPVAADPGAWRASALPR